MRVLSITSKQQQQQQQQLYLNDIFALLKRLYIYMCIIMIDNNCQIVRVM